MNPKDFFKVPKYSLGLALIGVSGIRALSQFLIFAFVGVSGGLSQAGTLALAYAISGPIFVFLSMGMRTLILTHKQHFELRSVEKVRVWSSLFSLLICAFAALLVSPETAITTIAIALTKVPDGFGELYSSFMQRAHQISRMAFPQLIVVVTQTIVFITIFALRKNLIEAAIYSSITAAALQFSYVRSICYRSLRIQNTESIKIKWNILLHQCAPSGFSDGILSFAVNIPTLVLAYYYDTEIVGVFSFGLYLISGIELILNGVSQAWISGARQLSLEGKLGTSRTLLQGLKWLPLVALSSTIGYLALTIFSMYFNSESNQTLEIPIAAVTLVIFFEPFMFASSTALNVLNKYKSGLLSSSIALCVALISAYLLIPNLQISGAYLTLGVLMFSRLITNQSFIFREQRELKLKVD